jgi:hypothetical protein
VANHAGAACVARLPARVVAGHSGVIDLWKMARKRLMSDSSTRLETIAARQRQAD